MRYKSSMTESYRKVLNRLNEAPNDDVEEKDMAVGQLEFIKYACDEIKMYAQRDGIEEWFQNKLSGAHSTMKDLHSYIEGEEGKKGLNNQKEEIDLEEAFMDAYVIRFRDKGASENSVVVFKQEHDKDIYVDFLKKKGAKVLSVKKQNLNMKV